jgi:hypothetical protein
MRRGSAETTLPFRISNPRDFCLPGAVKRCHVVRIMAAERT